MLLDEHSKWAKRPNGHQLDGQKVRLADGQRFEERIRFLDRVDGHQEDGARSRLSAVRSESLLTLRRLVDRLACHQPIDELEVSILFTKGTFC
jgi:hypothetical protein